MIILDMNGKSLREGDKVRVHQDSGISLATVMDISNPLPTLNQEGWWIDIEKEEKQGLEGMMTYILELIDEDI